MKRFKESFTLLPLSFLALLLINATVDNGCSAARSASGHFTPATHLRTADFLEAKLRANRLESVRYFSAKAKIYSESEGSAVNASANIIWYRDSVIWINVKKFGVEAARALIRPDSVFVIDRLNQTYLAESIAEWQRRYGIPAGFDLMQDLLLANAWLPEGQPFQADIKDSLYRLSAAMPRYTIDYRLEEGRYALHRAAYLQPGDARSLTIDFEHYEKLDGVGFFPYLRHIETYSPETGSLQLQVELSEIDIHAPKPYRFSIPDFYRKVD